MSLFYCCEKMFILLNIWMIEKNLVKHHYLKKKKKYSHLNIEEITHADYVHTKRVCKDFEKKLGEYHDLYVQSNTLFLTDVFENFKNMCLMWYRYVINEIKRKQQKYQRFHLEKLINISYRWRNIAF